MGADNWTKCPRCRIGEEQRQLDAQSLAEQNYGKVPVAKYEELRRKAKPVAIDNTLREDYEIGVAPDGRFRVSFEAICQRCGFHFEFMHANAIEIKEKK